MKNLKNKFEIKDPSYFILRIGLSLVVLWFGINQLINTNSFTGFVPDFLEPIEYQLVIFNAIFEIITAVLLLFNKFPKIVSTLLAIHLIPIIIELGYSSILIRDIGILAGFIAIALYKEK